MFFETFRSFCWSFCGKILLKCWKKSIFPAISSLFRPCRHLGWLKSPIYWSSEDHDTNRNATNSSAFWQKIWQKRPQIHFFAVFNKVETSNCLIREIHLLIDFQRILTDNQRAINDPPSFVKLILQCYKQFHYTPFQKNCEIWNVFPTIRSF